MLVSDLLLNATLEELKQGYAENSHHFICLFCEKRIDRGIIYPHENVLYEAGKYMCLHIEEAHNSAFDYLIGLDKKLTGMSDHQSNLMRLFYEGKSDADIQKQLNVGSSSTIRAHRFALKEKERQAKIFLALMELLKEKDKHGSTFANLHKTAKMVDDRYNATREESEKILKRLFPQGTDGPLKTFSIREKHKLVVLNEIAKRFAKGKVYTEKEVNEILKTAYDDFATLRRYLIEYGFLDRKADGSQYWIKTETHLKEEGSMDRRKELKQQYKEVKAEAGVYQIKNMRNEKIFIGSSLNLKSLNGKLFTLEGGSFPYAALQKEWNEFGKEAFVIEVLEVLETKEDEFFDAKDALKKLEKKWLDKLQPYGDRGYN